MSNIKEIKGNIFDTSCQTIVNTVNCQWFMWKWLALEYKYRFPEMVNEYMRYCSSGRLNIGILQIWKESTPRIINFPTKFHRKFPSKMEYIEKGLQYFVGHYKERWITSVAFPRLWASLWWLERDDVKKIMFTYLENLDIDIEIYEYDPHGSDRLFDVFKDKLIKLSPQQAAKEIWIPMTKMEVLQRGILDGSIKNMWNIQGLDKFWEETIKKIYQFALDKYAFTSNSLF